MENNSERLCDLLGNHKALEQEELFLNLLISKIDKQIHALQVEQLNIINTKNQTEINPINCNNMTITGDVLDVEPTDNEAAKNSSLKNGHELDLRPIKKYNDSEEDEEDDDLEDNEKDDDLEDNEKDREFPNNSADFDYL